jgi:quinoprotein relay system zinc metallohydrolase 2
MNTMKRRVKWHIPDARRARLPILGCGCLFAVVSAFSVFADGALPVQEVAPGAYVHIGAHSLATPENEGAIANVGFIIGARCVAVIDSGGTFAEGEALLAAIRSRTSLPVCYVINTHVHPDHIYGNAAFAVDAPHFVGHRHLAAAMRGRHDYYVEYLQRTVGPELAVRSVLVEPDMTVERSTEIDLGGRTLLLQAWPTSHTDTDLTVLDKSAGTLWLGDLLFREHIPVVDGSVSGWLATLDKLATVKVKQVVPGHGDVSSNWPDVMGPQQQYLTKLRADVRRALKENRSLMEATVEIDASDRERWALFDVYHEQNITAAYTELEWEE